MLQIRKMQMADLDRVCAIEKNSFSMPWSRKSFEETLANPNVHYMVACGETEPELIMGYCGAYVILDEADINQVAVAEAYRKKGVGRQMLQAMLEQLQQIGVKAVTLEVRKSNEAAIALYESLGFIVEGVRKNFYEKPAEDALIMWKR